MIGSPKVATIAEVASSTTLKGNNPPGLADGDLVLCLFGASSAPASTSITAGWTAAPGVGTTGEVNIASTRTLGVFYQVLGAGGAAAFVAPTVTQSPAGRLSVSMVAYAGVDSTTPFDANGAWNVNNAVTTVVSSVTTVTAEATLVGAAVVDAATATDITVPASMTKLSGTTGTGRRMAVANETTPFPTAGTATGTRTWTETGTTGLAMGAMHVLLRPAVVAGGGGRPKVWTGSQWLNKPGKWWNGSAWIEKPWKVWDGSAWKIAK